MVSNPTRGWREARDRAVSKAPAAGEAGDVSVHPSNDAAATTTPTPTTAVGLYKLNSVDP